ncbi:MAG: hypothetical protein LPK02_07180 [Rhodobacterales bacterium]|nr:hypothetical protein [Rhodobacterales bacterium]
MTIHNDQNDRVALAHGFHVIDHPRGRDHAHSSYVKGALTVWMINGMHDGKWWRSAIMHEGRYTDHQSHDTLEAALSRSDVE